MTGAANQTYIPDRFPAHVLTALKPTHRARTAGQARALSTMQCPRGTRTPHPVALAPTLPAAGRGSQSQSLRDQLGSKAPALGVSRASLSATGTRVTAPLCVRADTPPPSATSTRSIFTQTAAHRVPHPLLRRDPPRGPAPDLTGPRPHASPPPRGCRRGRARPTGPRRPGRAAGGTGG